MRNAAERSFWTLPDHPTERGIGIDRSPLTARPSASTPSPISRRTKVTTIEGLATEGALHALQHAFINHEAFQHGYCTPGQICSAAGLIAEGKAKTADEIRELMSGNICRCGAYPNILAAIQQVMGQS